MRQKLIFHSKGQKWLKVKLGPTVADFFETNDIQFALTEKLRLWQFYRSHSCYSILGSAIVFKIIG